MRRIWSSPGVLFLTPALLLSAVGERTGPASQAGPARSPAAEFVAEAEAHAERDASGPATASCSAPDPERVTLSATAAGLGGRGYVELAMPPSPFGVSVTGDGRYLYDVTVSLERVRRRPGEALVAWAATPELDLVKKLGVIGSDGFVRTRVEWNKFLVFVTAERDPEVDRWEGPILFTAISPSGLMHTMRGHGIFEAHGIGC